MVQSGTVTFRDYGKNIAQEKPHQATSEGVPAPPPTHTQLRTAYKARTGK